MHEVVAAYNDWLRECEIPKLMFYASPGAITREREVAWCQANLKHLTTVDLGEGIHYLQEDHPGRIGAELRKWMENAGE